MNSRKDAALCYIEINSSVKVCGLIVEFDNRKSQIKFFDIVNGCQNELKKCSSDQDQTFDQVLQ